MSNYTEQDLQSQLKPLSDNAFIRFFQKILRAYLSWWYNFADKHEKLAPWIYKVGFFIIFSLSVTVYQYIVMTFLPYAFAALNTGAAGWPGIEVGNTGEQYIIFGDTKGWGYFIAFELAVFTAQCINFPLQRNITYKSHGNPWYQAMWYFIGWVLVSIFTNAVWGICNVYLVYWGWPDAVTGLLKTVLTGGVSMVIFFFIFLIIFPDNNAVEKKAKAKYEKFSAGGADSAKIAEAEESYRIAAKKAEYSNAENEAHQAKSQFNSKAMRYFALKNAKEPITEEKLNEAFEEAVAALETKNEKEVAFEEIKAKAEA